ncbi:hypothetical protein ON010_g16642 [Phytophthora cinnamomi]|nr:hypothetical protein ON010_g16642 [Phytophthora cinnamomi]
MQPVGIYGECTLHPFNPLEKPEEQVPSLFPDKHSVITCPLHIVGMALAIQSYPISLLLDLEQFSCDDDEAQPPNLDEPPLMEALLCCDEDDEPTRTTSEAATKRAISAPLKIQGYVHRFVEATSEPQTKAGVPAERSSHSFCLGAGSSMHSC